VRATLPIHVESLQVEMRRRRRQRRQACDEGRRARGQGVTLRLLLDPNGDGPETRVCSPSAVDRRTRDLSRIGFSHVTLKSASSSGERRDGSFVRGLRAWRDTEPMHSVATRIPVSQELLRFAKRVGAELALRTGKLRRIVEHDGRLLLAPPADETKDPELKARSARPASPERIWFPARGADEDPTRAEADEAGLGAEHRARPGGMLPRGDAYRAFLGTATGFREAGTIRRGPGESWDANEDSARFTPGSVAVSCLRSRAAVCPPRHRRPQNTVVVGPRNRLNGRASPRAARPRRTGRASSTGKAALPLRRRSPRGRADWFRFPALELRRARIRRGAVVRPQFSYDGEVVVGSGLVTFRG